MAGNKKTKSAGDLAQLILDRCKDLEIHSLGVHRDEQDGGWYAIVVADPKYLADYQSTVDELVAHYQGWYDLED